ncbi:dTDP-4-dehydrorhamnose reductase [Pseudoalteromonas neustonica]|uniref:dTDP-4-dehydrorhamnose reductase n=1 Tax=Pseudoalteromonas neustonica TaxID=1840331 RepID=A0ABU9U1R7_9GAMM|nr:dTDP-4-dehydrorhamnose reductase [Pseudoalteromonas sp. NEC-BIFX-2020_015]NMR23961.1 dTDP-4-dehydrorhamnose reductase [Pseudoalteromonas sp. NEC-BIFX-2020_015]
MKALIIGKSGQLASELIDTCPTHIEAVAYGRADIDLMQIASIRDVVLTVRPDFIINAAAYTLVDQAQTDSENAFALNRDAVASIAQVAKEYGARLIHISTDFVFDGRQNTAYFPDHIPNPINVYGESKLAGEEAITRIYADNSTVVRTSWVYSSYGNNFVKTMLRLMSEKDRLCIVSDQIGCPTNAKGLAEFLWFLCEVKGLSTRYHYSDLGVSSWYDFAVAIQTLACEVGILDKAIPLVPISSENYPTPAIRPKFSLLADNQGKEHWYSQLKCFFKSE